jgi:hypothetical protein
MPIPSPFPYSFSSTGTHSLFYFFLQKAFDQFSYLRAQRRF